MPTDSHDTQTPEIDERRREIALFRYGVIADLVHIEPHHRGLYALLAKKAEHDYTIPGSLRRHVASETMRGWLRAYRLGGFDALAPRVRTDQGCSRSIPTHVVDLLCQMKEDSPELSVPALIKIVRADHADVVTGEIVLPESTVHRVLARRGLMKKRPEDPTSKDRRRFEHESAGDLWMSDVMYGPKIRDAGWQRQTYLIAFIDDATRVVPHASFTFSEGTISYLSVLEQAVRRRGIPKRLYVDNGSAYRARHLALVCAKLGVTLIHARPFSPQGKGKLERWFRTVRVQLLPTLLDADTRSLDALNQRLWTWIEDEYLDTPHRGLQDVTPREQWARAAHHVTLPTQDLTTLFLFEEKRKVQQDRTVSLHSVVFEVDAALVGQTVTLRYDPTHLTRGVTVVVQGRAVGTAKRVDAYANCFVRRDHGTKLLTPSTASVPAPGLPLRKLDEDF